MPERDFSELIAGMVVNENFKNSVLDPKSRAHAILNGYAGQQFHFTDQELELIHEIAATELPSFAAEILEVRNNLYPTVGGQAKVAAARFAAERPKKPRK